jgi:hypothetical protein
MNNNNNNNHRNIIYRIENDVAGFAPFSPTSFATAAITKSLMEKKIPTNKKKKQI